MTEPFAAASSSFLDGEARPVPRQVLGILSRLPTASLEALVRSAAAEMTRDHVTLDSTDSATSIHELPGLEDVHGAREAFAAVCVIVATCSRDNALQNAAEQRQRLDDMGIEDGALQTALLPLLATAVPPVQLVLEHSSFDFAHVVDVSWRLDDVLRSSSAGSVHTPLYFVQLKLQSPNADESTPQTLAFSCSVEQLRALVYKVQEAANELEKLAAGSATQLRASG